MQNLLRERASILRLKAYGAILSKMLVNQLCDQPDSWIPLIRQNSETFI